MRFCVITLLIWLISYQATACTCVAAPAPNSVRFDKSISVFLARVKSIRTADILGKIMGASGLNFRAKLNIIESYKGSPPEIYEVSGKQDDGANCGIDIVEGEYYLIFITEHESGDNHLGLCDQPLNFSKDLDSPIAKEILGEMRSLRDKQRH